MACKYCEYSEKEIPIYKTRWAEVTLSEKTLYVETTETSFRIEIEYCPKCGEKLKIFSYE